MIYENIWQDFKPHAIRLAGFLLVSIIIALVIPLKRSSRYQYSNGKPWQGALLTAPYDFPIYKSDEQIKRERDSITAKQTPVYKYQPDIGLMMMAELQDEYQSRLSKTIPGEYFAYLNKQLQRYYENGIVSDEERNKLRERKTTEIFLLREGNELEPYLFTKLHSIREVHEQIMKDLPTTLDRSVLAQMHVEHLLKENVVYNQEMSQRLLDENLSNISLSIGLVQAGQRIVDKGEIVSSETYNLLRSLEIEQEKRLGNGIDQLYSNRLGVFIITFASLFLLAMCLLFLIHSFVPNTKNIALILISVFLFVLATSVVSYYGVFNIYMIPYVMIVILLRTFMDSYTSLVSFIIAVLLSAIFVVEPLSFIIIQMLAGLSALVILQKLTSRGKMIRAGFGVYAVYVLAYLGMFLITDGNFTFEYWKTFLVFGVNLIFLNFTYILSAVVERTFGYVSNVSLIEISDIQSPLLKELSEIAPGTFQHSLQVSTLASDATDKIGGDVQLVRAGALYHDIGKMKNPAYFTENQGSVNPHDLLSQEESAAIIVRHVTDGIALAQKHNLPLQIIEFIRTHHGDSLVRYFYNTYCNQHPDEEVDPQRFSYPGPKPYTKEQGILMLADATEASSRSLKEYSVGHITEHVHRVVDSIVADGQLSDTPLSFRDIQIIKEVFVSKLKTMYHTRISYPERKV